MQSSFTALIKASVVIFCVGLSACDLANGAAGNAVVKKVTNGPFGEPTIVMAPGWRMDDHGRQALIFGRSHCPDANGNNTSEDGCVVMDAHSAAVAVIVVDVSDQSVRKETWEIERKGDRTIVKRPDNSYVIPWGK